MAIQRSALLKVVKVKGRKIQADIVRLITPVSSGEVVKRLEGGE